MFRQGDVLLVKVKELPKKRGFFSIVREYTGDVVLAYGEATGHAHILDKDKVKAFVQTDEKPTKGVWDQSAERFIQVLEKTNLKHRHLPTGEATGEHADIELDPGVYKVVRQREWTEETNRWVED